MSRDIVSVGETRETYHTLPRKVGRMMNTRGMILDALDDPEHTVHQQTLQFATHTNSSSSALQI